MMPNPKVGTVTMDVTGAVKGAKGGSVEFRVEKAGHRAGRRRQGVVHRRKSSCRTSRRSPMPFRRRSRSGAKGNYINRVAVSSTMGPGVKVEPGSLFGSSQAS